MDRQLIDVRDLDLQPFATFDPDGVLLVSGTSVGDANVMTISWGMFGIMWGKPVMMTMVRPTRHTWQFITRAPDFTVNWLPAELKGAVQLCGSASGRDMDKFATAGLHPVPGSAAQSPVLAESLLALECRIIYRDDVQPARFLDAALANVYPGEDYHGLFFGEVISAACTDRFRRAPGG